MDTVRFKGTSVLGNKFSAKKIVFFQPLRASARDFADKVRGLFSEKITKKLVFFKISFTRRIINVKRTGGYISYESFFVSFVIYKIVSSVKSFIRSSFVRTVSKSSNVSNRYSLSMRK